MWNFRETFWIVSVMLILTGCSHDSLTYPRDEEIDDEREAALASGATLVSREELEVYMAFLESRKHRSSQFPIIGIHTASLPNEAGLPVLQTYFVSLRAETFKALEELNDSVGVLDDSLHEALGVSLISDTTLGIVVDSGDVDNPFVEPIWSAGHMRFTRVGISSDRQQALFFMRFLRGGRSGYAAFILMERGGRDRWESVGEFVIYEY